MGPPVPAPTVFTYDVFISCSHADKDWVCTTLLPRLEQAGLRVCIDYCHFVPGRPALFNVQLELVVPACSFAAGRQILEPGLPKEDMIVLIGRPNGHIVPDGKNGLKAGDRLVILSDRAVLKTVRRIIAPMPGPPRG
jgi:hypothetical protein